MKLLAIDSVASLCAACVYDAGRDAELGRHVVDLGKGHAEHLIKVIDAALAKAAMGYRDLDAIAVSVGPGSFTGIRVAVAAARGFALALAIPAIGVDTLAAIAQEARTLHGAQPIMAALPSGPDHVQAAVYDAFGRAIYTPRLVRVREAANLAEVQRAMLAGAAAPLVLSALGQPSWPIGPTGSTADILAFARVAASVGASAEPPRPLYLREPDARPQAGFILPRAAGIRP